MDDAVLAGTGLTTDDVQPVLGAPDPDAAWAALAALAERKPFAIDRVARRLVLAGAVRPGARWWWAFDGLGERDGEPVALDAVLDVVRRNMASFATLFDALALDGFLHDQHYRRRDAVLALGDADGATPALRRYLEVWDARHGRRPEGISDGAYDGLLDVPPFVEFPLHDGNHRVDETRDGRYIWNLLRRVTVPDRLEAALLRAWARGVSGLPIVYVVDHHPGAISEAPASSLAGMLATEPIVDQHWDDEPGTRMEALLERLVARRDDPGVLLDAATRLRANGYAWGAGVLGAAGCLRILREGGQPPPELVAAARPWCTQRGDGERLGRELLDGLSDADARRVLAAAAAEDPLPLPYFSRLPADLDLARRMARGGHYMSTAAIVDAGALPSAFWREVAAASDEDAARFAQGAATVAVARERGDAVKPADLFDPAVDQVLYPDALLRALPRYVRDASGKEWVKHLTNTDRDVFDFGFFLRLAWRIAPRAFDAAVDVLAKKPTTFQKLKYQRRAEADLFRAILRRDASPKTLAVIGELVHGEDLLRLLAEFDPAAPHDPALLQVYLRARGKLQRPVPFTALGRGEVPAARGWQACARSRIGGPGLALPRPPVGPDGAPMVHVATFFAAEIPGLGLPPEGAVAIYLSDPMRHEAFAPGTPHAAVVVLDGAGAAAGPAGPSARDLAEEPVYAASFQVPSGLGDAEWEPVATDLDGFAGMRPVWVQGADVRKKHGRFLLQGMEDLFPVNLGDAGTLYVFERTAFMECS